MLLAALFAWLPLWANNVALREDLILVAIAIILTSNLNLIIGDTGYVKLGHTCLTDWADTLGYIWRPCAAGTWWSRP